MTKDEIKNIIRAAKNFHTYQDKLNFLHNRFEGETCYVLGCGPSLAEVNKDNLKKELQSNLCLSIKIAYFSFLELVDFHFFNSNNFINYPYNDDTFIISSSDFLTEKQAKSGIWQFQENDINLMIGRQNKNEMLARTKQIERWLFNNSATTRPWGPGIMYESVLFFAYHLGCTEIKTIGWDYKDPQNKEKISHFYEEEWRLSNLKNPAAQPYVGEIVESINLADEFHEFFVKRKVKLKAMNSHKCFLSDKIERFTL